MKECISKCRIAALKVGGRNSAHRDLHGLLIPPTRDILKCARLKSFLEYPINKSQFYGNFHCRNEPLS
jgi:hypothetical protein